MRFTDLRTTRKGSRGEHFAKELLTKMGVPVYPAYVGPHFCDFIVLGRESLLFVDVKTYPRRWKEAATGIDLADWSKYRRLSDKYGQPFYLLFIDVFERAVYGATIDRLSQGAKIEGRKIYFPLERLRIVYRLRESDMRRLPPIDRPERYERVRRFFNCGPDKT